MRVSDTECSEIDGLSVSTSSKQGSGNNVEEKNERQSQRLRRKAMNDILRTSVAILTGLAPAPVSQFSRMRGGLCSEAPPVAEELLAMDDCRGRCKKGGKGTHKLIGHNLFTSNAFLLLAHLLLSTILVRIRRNGFHYGVFICLCHCILLIFVSSPFHTFSIKKIWSREIKQKSCLYAVSVSWTLSL